MSANQELYFEWLYSKIRVGGSPYDNHFSLLRAMNSTEFVYLVVGDDNRIGDAEDIRNEFIRRHGGVSGDEDPRVSVFEVLIALALRMATLTELPEQYWFWKFVSNMGLEDQTDDDMSFQLVEDILSRFVWRTYNDFGHGGSIFPVARRSEKDRWPELELWRQMSLYLDETGLNEGVLNPG